MLTACSGASNPAGAPKAPLAEAALLGQQVSLPENPPDERIHVWPSVEFIPANKAELLIVSDEPISLQGQQLSIVNEDGFVLLGGVGKWTWRDERREMVIAPRNLEVGPKYGLLVEGFMTDKEEILASWVHWFRVGSEDTTPPDAALVELRGDAKIGSTTPVTVRFTEAMDHRSVNDLTVLVLGRPVEGSWSLAEGQRVFVFTPSAPWEGNPFVSMGASVSDLAGNAIVHRPAGPAPVMIPVVTPAE
jgi:hypothetical protein